MKKPQTGSVAIIMVLITLTILTTIVIEILYKSKVSATIVTNRRDGEKAYELARSAVRWSLFRLDLDNTLDKIQEIPMTNYGGKKDDLTEMQWAAPLPYPFAAATVGKDGKSSGPPPEELGGSFVSVLFDESAKINLNSVGTLTLPNQPPQWSGPSEVLENLFLSPRFAPYFKNGDHRNILWAIDDWIDADSNVNHTGGGIEDIEYKTDDPNHHVKNGPFYSVEEIRELKPMTDELFRELRPFVTVYPFDARIPKVDSTTPNVTGVYINVNTAPLEIIASTFSRQALGDWKARYECAQKLIQYRSGIVFRKINPDFFGAIQKLCAIDPTGGNGGVRLFNPLVERLLAVRSDTFSIEGTGNVENVTRTIQAVVSRDPRLTKPKILFWKVI